MTLQNRLIIDSALPDAEALAQNPRNPAPPDIAGAQRVVGVEYVSFDGAIHAGQIVVHEDVADEVQKFFTLARVLAFPIQKVIPIGVPAYAWDDDRSCDDNNTSGWNYRLVSGKNRLSNHAFGRAFDVNPIQNPYIRFDAELKEIFRAPAGAAYDETVPGTLTKQHPLVLLMKGLGWEWGGDWTPESGRIDYQHFEKPQA